MEDDKKFLDFIASLILILLGSFFLVYSIAITVKTGSRIMVSPGLLPGILGSGLILCAAMLLVDCLKTVGLKTVLEQIAKWWDEDIIHSRQTRNTLFGILLTGVYTCIMMAVLPYWLATVIMLLFLFWYLHATTPVKGIIIAVLTVAAVVGVFQYLFHVRLP